MPGPTRCSTSRGTAASWADPTPLGAAHPRSTRRARRDHTPTATCGRRSTTHSIRPVGNCRARHNADVAGPPNASLASGTPGRRARECRCERAPPRAGAPTRAQPLPRRVGNEVLQRLIVAGRAQPAMRRLDRLPLTVVQQTIEIPTGRGPLRLPAEARAEPVEELSQRAPSSRRERTGVPHISTRATSSNGAATHA